MINSDQHSPLMVVPLRVIAGVMLLTALCLAPLNYGSTRLVPLVELMALLALGVVAWILSSLLGRRFSLPPTTACVGALLLVGSALAWLLFLTRPEIPEFTRDHLARVIARWPFSVVPREFSITAAWTASWLVAFFALTDFAREPVWRYAIATVILATGAAFAVLGLVQNASSARGIYWDDTQRMPGAFFGTLFHHTAAGAYLNTVWPMGLALALSGLQRRVSTPRTRSMIVGALACTILVFAAHAGHISRLPQVIGVAALIVLVVWTRLWRALGRIPGLRVAMATAAILFLAVLVAAGSTRIDAIRARWDQLQFGAERKSRSAMETPPVERWTRLMRDDLFIPSNHGAYLLGDRGAAYDAAFAAIKARPWFGWGPGGWTAAAAAHSVDPFVRTFYLMLQFTHSDFLQTCVEWGLVGAAGWALLIPASAVNAGAKLWAFPSRDFFGAAAATGLTAVLVQSLIDFPLQIPAVQLNATALAALCWTVPVIAAPAQ